MHPVAADPCRTPLKARANHLDQCLGVKSKSRWQISMPESSSMLFFPVQIQAINKWGGRRMRRRMAERLRCGKGTKILISRILGWLLQWKGRGPAAPRSTCPFSNQGVVVVQDMCVMNAVSRCPHKCLGGLAGVKKRGCVLLHRFCTLGTRAVSPAPFLKNGDRRRKVMSSGNTFRGNMKKAKQFAFFNQIFIRGVNRSLHPLARPQADECTDSVGQSKHGDQGPLPALAALSAVWCV